MALERGWCGLGTRDVGLIPMRVNYFFPEFCFSFEQFFFSKATQLCGQVDKNVMVLS